MASTTAETSHIISNLHLGADADGVDFKVFGDTSGAYMLWDASANNLLFTGAAGLSYGTLSSDDQTGISLSSTNPTVLDVFADDNDTALTNAVYHAIRGRTMLFKTPTEGSIFSVMGQIKCADEVDFNPGVFAGVRGYIETMDDTDIKSGAKMWAVDGCLDAALASYTVKDGGISAAFHAELTGAGTFTQDSGGILAGVYIDETATTGNWGYGLYIAADSTTYGIYIGDCTTAAINIAGDQAIGILFDVDSAATDGLKIAVDDGITLTRGINIDRTGTTGTCTTAISIDTDGTTGIEIAAGFTGVDMIVLAGTASGYGIEISGTCSTADLLLQNGATINNDAAGSLTITEDSITLVAGGASKLVFGGITDWGTGATGTLIDGTGYDWVSQTVGRVNANLNSTAAAAAYHALSVTANQTSSNSCFGTWTELYFDDSVSLAAADNFASVWAQMEGGTSVAAPTTAGDFMAAVYANIVMGTTFTTGADSVVDGVRVQSEIASGSISHAGRLAAFECLTKSGSYQNWDYGIYGAGVERAGYFSSALTGSSALNNLELAVTDATTNSSGYSRGLYIGATVSGTKTGSGEFNGVGVDMTLSGDTPYAYGLSLYAVHSGNPTLGFVAPISIYIDDLGNACGALMGIDIGMAGGSNSPADRHTGIRFRNHTAGQPPRSFARLEGSPTSDYLFEFENAAALPLDNGSTAGDQCVGHIKLLLGSTTGYINVYSDNS